MFHVPHASRVRRTRLASDDADGNNGAFVLPSPESGWWLIIIASDGDGWEHVSVHAERPAGGTHIRSRVPRWSEMCFAKATFWDPEDVVMQLHPRASEYVNQHPDVLHLWRPIGCEIPTPDAGLVGDRDAVPERV
jgi:hypothetical protein